MKILYPHYRQYLLLLVAAIAMLPGCNCNKFKQKPDVSGIKVDLQVQRFERDLLQVDTTNLAESLGSLQQQYLQFVNVWGNMIMGLGDLQLHHDAALVNYSYFLRDTMARNLLDKAYSTFEPFDKYTAQFTQAFKYYKHYFPGKPVPQVITCISFFERSAVTYDTTILALCLDMHLGSKFPYPTSIPLYVQQTLTPEYLVPHGVKVLYGMAFETQPKDRTLLAEMIHNGIQLYFVDLLLPDTPDHLKMDYTEQQQKWCVDNEAQMWDFFLEKKLLYGTEMMENRNYIYPGPFTSGMPTESPGNTGSWLGWQIIRKFMEVNPQTKFEELLVLEPQDILTRSKYKPKF